MAAGRHIEIYKNLNNFLTICPKATKFYRGIHIATALTTIYSKIGFFKVQNEWWSRLIILVDVERMDVWLRISRILSMKLLEFLLGLTICRNYLILSLIWCLHYYYALRTAREIIVLKPNNLKPQNLSLLSTNIDALSACTFGQVFY